MGGTLTGYSQSYYGYGDCYGSLNLTASSPSQSFTEPLSLSAVKSYLNLPERQPRDNAEDALLNAFISAAREVAEIAQGRDLVRKQWDLTYDYFWSLRIELREPLVSVDLVQYTQSDGTVVPMVAGTDYIVDIRKHPGIITPPYNAFWPISFTGYPSSAVLIRFTSGLASTDAFWADAGQRVKVGMLMLISNWFTNRLPFDAVRYIQEYPMAVTALLNYGAVPRVR